MKKDNQIEFLPIPIDNSYGKIIENVFVIIENGRCKVYEELNKLEENDKDDIIDLISKLSTIKDFKSAKIKHCLKKYSYGEIKPRGHRVFYFKKCGNNIILFNYSIKKKNSLGNTYYKKLEREKRRYENEFKKQYK